MRALWLVLCGVFTSGGLLVPVRGQDVARPVDLGDRIPPKVTRAERPVFRFADWEGIYFENLFRDGLVGPKPIRGGTAPSPAVPEGQMAVLPGGSESNAGSSPWPQIVAAEVIEDEIKRTVVRLADAVATPSKYHSDYLSARQSFSMLSLWFAIIFEYQEAVRWRQHAAAIQPAMARAAANARVSSEQSYQYARARLEALQQLLRGEVPDQVEMPVESIDWPSAVGRPPMMVRMQECIDDLKSLSADAGTFRRSRGEIEHQSQVLAALSLALIRPDMDDADEEDYAKHARALMSDALAALQAARLDQFAEWEKSIKRIERRCNDCHEEWR